jgi:hypothetical protein
MARPTAGWQKNDAVTVDHGRVLVNDRAPKS